MIIEAGYDVHQLMHPALFENDASRRGLWALTLDSDLRLLFVDQVSEEVPETLADAAPDLVALFQHERVFEVRYFFLAHMVSSIDSNAWHHMHAEDTALSAVPEMANYELLGRLVFDGEFVCSTAPRYSFRDYFGLEHLPRAAAFPGPHPLVGCECAACVQFEAKLARNRARNAQLSPAAGEIAFG